MNSPTATWPSGRRLSPTGATYVGIAGHDDQLDDLSPEGYRARGGPHPPDPRRPGGDRAGDRVGADRQGGHAGTARPGPGPVRRRRGDQRGQRDHQRAARDPHGVRPDADRDGRRARPTSPPGSTASPARWRATRPPLREALAAGQVSSKVQLVEVAKQCDIWVDPTGDNFFHGLVERLDAEGTLGAGAAPGCGGGDRGDRRVRPVPAYRAGPARAGQAGRRPGALRAGLAVLPRRQGRPGRDVRLGFRGAGPAGGGDAGRGRADRRLRRHRRRGRGRAGRRPGPDHPGQGGVPGLDAGARRQGDRRAARHPLRHPGAGPPHRVLPRPDQRRRHLLHRPERGLLPPGPDVVGGAAGHHRLLHLARGDHRLPRGRARVTTSRSRRPPSGPTCSTAGSGCSAGSPGTARAGRSTPSG